MRIKKLKDRYAVTVDTGESLAVDEECCQPKGREEAGKLVEMLIMSI